MKKKPPAKAAKKPAVKKPPCRFVTKHAGGFRADVAIDGTQRSVLFDLAEDVLFPPRKRLFGISDALWETETELVRVMKKKHRARLKGALLKLAKTIRISEADVRRAFDKTGLETP